MDWTWRKSKCSHWDSQKALIPSREISWSLLWRQISLVQPFCQWLRRMQSYRRHRCMQPSMTPRSPSQNTKRKSSSTSASSPFIQQSVLSLVWLLTRYVSIANDLIICLAPSTRKHEQNVRQRWSSLREITDVFAPSFTFWRERWSKHASCLSYVITRSESCLSILWMLL